MSKISDGVYRIEVESVCQNIHPGLQKISNAVILEKPNGETVKRALPVVDWTLEMMCIDQRLAEATTNQMAADVKNAIIALGAEIPPDVDAILSPTARRVLMFDDLLWS
jgi:hypothetical protein